MNIRENLKIHGIELEEASSPAGNYVPYIITGKLVFISGQLPFKQGKIPITGVWAKQLVQKRLLRWQNYAL